MTYIEQIKTNARQATDPKRPAPDAPATAIIDVIKKTKELSETLHQDHSLALGLRIVDFNSLEDSEKAN